MVSHGRRVSSVGITICLIFVVAREDSSAIKQLQSAYPRSSDNAVIYHFFTVADRRSQTCDTLMRTLVYQLAGHNDKTRARVDKLSKEAPFPDYAQLLDAFTDLSKALSGVFIVIDALDECADQDSTCVFLRDLCSKQIPGLRILASSNTTQARETEAALTELKTCKIYATTDLVNNDIEAHIRKLDLGAWEDEQKDIIINHIREHSDGSFRWAVGQLMEINNCDTPGALEETLRSVPKSLTEMYERILSRIDSASHIQNLRTLLCWLLHARRPLRVEELRETVAINWQNDPYFDAKKRLNQRPRILDLCTFLIAIDQDLETETMFAIDYEQASASSIRRRDAVLRLAHASVLQFLQDQERLSAHARKFSTLQPAGDLIIVQSCLAYILHVDSATPSGKEPATGDYPLFDYAVQYWYDHAQNSGPDSQWQDVGSLIRDALRTTYDTIPLRWFFLILVLVCFVAWPFRHLVWKSGVSGFFIITLIRLRGRSDPASHSLTLEGLIRRTLQTKWEVYRLVTFPNPSTQYNPWAGDGSPDPPKGQCETCSAIRYKDLSGSEGFRLGIYADLVTSSRKCSLCEMIHRTLLQFGVARICQRYATTVLSKGDAEQLCRQVDAEIRDKAGSAEVWLRAEDHEPFLFIQCHCYFGRLHLFTEPGMLVEVDGREFQLTNTGSPLAKTIPGRRINLDTSTPEFLNTCASWVQRCANNHPACVERTTNSPFPTRVIDVGEEGDMYVRLRESSELPECARYATLSYCWGPVAPLLTTVENLELHGQGIPLREMPCTFRDAVAITRSLGIRGLWIDALCIIQGKENDWAVEATKMMDYFGNAVVNIVAGVAQSSSSIRRPRANPLFSPICISPSEDLYVGWLGTDMYCDPQGLNLGRYPDAWKYQSPPHTRAWVMQEIELARRNIVVQPDDGNWSPESGTLLQLSSQLYMQCQEEIRWESGRVRARMVHETNDWYHLVEVYSGRKLAYTSDRLPGISGLATKHCHTTGNQRGEYLAGLWRGELLRGLLWYSETESTSNDHAPSWSWASSSSRIRYVWPTDATLCAEVLDCQVSGRHQVKGHVIVRGFLVRIASVDTLVSLPTESGNLDVKIKFQVENGTMSEVRARCFLDDASSREEGPLGSGPRYALRISRRLALLLKQKEDDTEVKRIGLLIIAKPDVEKLESVTTQSVVKIV
ncbi:heterokaryon incompatibility protein-domain-containing protein [Podospora fimiseda]|uniref:Heterokaryon incompatibility protein-domain-containing protein n=1 Tax=Podospora fimiseda TaxID=252190 RepID=A0AAN7BMB3_9PEZI|nr:heterokaryon incompatibility protein-domain-containing protein [Podospora fimiseda]